MRNRSIDGLRGLLAVFVVIAHLSIPAVGGALAVFALASVMVFFIMSGYVLARAWDDDFPAFLARRAVRLWPTFAVCMAISGVVAGTMPSVGEFFWLHIAPPDANPPGWSMAIEIRAMLFMPVMVWCGRVSEWRMALGLIGVFMAVWWVDRMAVSGICFLLGARLAPFEFRVGWMERPALQWLGRISYSLYLSHWPLLMAAKAIGGGDWAMWAVAPLTIPAAWPVWWCIERPSIALSRCIRRRYRSETPAAPTATTCLGTEKATVPDPLPTVSVAAPPV